MLVVSKSAEWRGKKKNFDKNNFSEVLFYKDGEYNYPEKWNFVLLLTINFLSNFI